MQTFIKNTYSRIRKPVKGLYNLLPDSKRLGSAFHKIHDFLEESQWWSREQHETYQILQIGKLLDHACRNVPYYRELFGDIGIKADGVQNFNDLNEIPFLTRGIIRNHLRDLVAVNYKKRDIVQVTTGGSTSIPMGFFEDKSADARQKAYVAHQWSRVGYDINKRNRVAVLRGIPIDGLYQRSGNNLILSSYKMTKENREEYIKLISSFDPDFLHVYPSAISLLAEYLTDAGVRLHVPGLKAVLTSSEKISDTQKDRIEKAFGVRVFDLYGHAEHSCMAAECENSRLYHLAEEYGYTELIGKNGERITKEGEIGEVVCTGFDNYVVPFIRYKTGDMASWSAQTCSCGRNVRLLQKIEGRIQEFFVGDDGSPVTFTCSDDALWGVKDHIYAYQYVQDIPGKVRLKIIPKSGFGEEDTAAVLSGFHRFYPGLDIDVELTESIERTARGKFKNLIQNVHAPFHHNRDCTGII